MDDDDYNDDDDDDDDGGAVVFVTSSLPLSHPILFADLSSLNVAPLGGKESYAERERD